MKHVCLVIKPACCQIQLKTPKHWSYVVLLLLLVLLSALEAYATKCQVWIEQVFLHRQDFQFELISYEMFWQSRYLWVSEYFGKNTLSCRCTRPKSGITWNRGPTERRITAFTATSAGCRCRKRTFSGNEQRSRTCRWAGHLHVFSRIQQQITPTWIYHYVFLYKWMCLCISQLFLVTQKMAQQYKRLLCNSSELGVYVYTCETTVSTPQPMLSLMRLRTKSMQT